MSQPVTIEQLNSELSNLIDIIKTTVKTAKIKNKPNKELFRSKQLHKFDYLKSHFTSSLKNITIERDDWGYVMWPLQQHIEKFTEYQKLLKTIPQLFPKFKNNDLVNFAVKVIRLYLHDEVKGFHSKKNLIKAFFKELHDELLLYKADFEITGVALQPEIIKISRSIYLKKVTKEDVEEPIPIEDFIRHRRYNYNSRAKLHVEYSEKRKYIDFHKWQLIMTILRLYKVADVKYESSKIISESTEDWMRYGEKTIWSDHHFIFGCLLTEKDSKELPKFWKIIEKYIPDSFKVPFTQRDNITIAYQRYLEAMTNPGDDEMRIAFGVAALEALFLAEEGELKYRLRMRVSRILGIMGLDPNNVYRDIGVAYDVRSTFDHGDKLKVKDIMKIRKMYNAKDERVLTLIILDYVRISLITVIMSKVSKGRIINLIDKSWVSSNDLSELRTIFQGPIKLLNLKSYRPTYSISPFNDADFSYIIQ